MPNFNFYQRAYKINQAFGDSTMTTIPLTNIKMGDTSLTDRGIAFYHTKSLYADRDSWLYNRGIFNVGGALTSTELWANNFSVSSTGRDHQAEYLSGANIGPATPKLNEVVDNIWDGTCYPCALGDTRDHKEWDDLRDGSWVEAGYIGIQTGNGSSTTATLNIYQANPSGPIWLNSINTNTTFNTSKLNMRVFTSPSLTSDNTPNLGIPAGCQLITFFAWSPTGNSRGGPIFYYELFGWDLVNNVLTSYVNIDLTAQYGFYGEIPYTGKHDIFHTTQWISQHAYRATTEFLIFFSPGKINQIDLSNGSITQRNGSAGAYSDVYDIFCYADNLSESFNTFEGAQGLTSPPISSINSVFNNRLIGLNVFDADYRADLSFNDHFYFGDHRPDTGSNGVSGIVGWSVRIDTGTGNIIGAFDQITLYNNPFIFTPYTLKRVVVVAPMQLIVGSGPNKGSQKLIRIICGYYGGSWYRAGAFIDYSTNSMNEDFISMNHGYCEDCTGTFDDSGEYPVGVTMSFGVPAYTAGLPVGAGNQHILSLDSNMGFSLFSQNTGLDYQTQAWSSSFISSHYLYVLYLGARTWNSQQFQSSPNYTRHNSFSYLYINITGVNSAFSNPTSNILDPASFGTGNGGLRTLVFYG